MKIRFMKATSMKTIAVIPARAGSKRIKNKNIKLLSGKPLICYTIETALKIKQIDKIFISTDIDQLEKIVETYKDDRISLIRREKSLSGDYITTEAVLIDVLEKIDSYQTVQGVITLSPTSPFRNVDVIEKCIQLFYQKRADSVFTISVEKLRIGFWDKKTLRFSFKNKNMLPEMHLVEPETYENPAVYVTKPSVLFGKRFVIGEVNYGVPIDKISGLDINDMEDWAIAEAIIEKRLVG